MTKLQPQYTNWLRALRTVVIAFGIFIGGQIAGASIATFLGYAAGKNQETISWAFESHDVVRFLLILCVELSTVYFIYWFLQRNKQTFADIGLVGKPLKADVVVALKGIVAYFIIFITIFSAVSATGLIDTDQQQQLGYTNPAGFGLMWAFLALVILPPLAEEILFRGYLFHNLKRYINVYASGVIVSLLFAAAHLEIGTGVPLNFAAALDTFVLSCVLVYVTHKSGSLWPAIGIHALKNLVAFATLFIIK